MNNTDYLYIMTPVIGWDTLGTNWTFLLKFNVLEAGKMSKCKDLSQFDEGQIVKARRLGRASPQLQLVWGVPSLQWSVLIKGGPSKEQWWTRVWKSCSVTAQCLHARQFRLLSRSVFLEQLEENKICLFETACGVFYSCTSTEVGQITSYL